MRREEHLLLRPLHEHRDVRPLVDAGGPSFHQDRFPLGFRLQELLQLLRIRQQLLPHLVALRCQQQLDLSRRDILLAHLRQ